MRIVWNTQNKNRKVKQDNHSEFSCDTTITQLTQNRPN